jgi:hypothetical protein
MRIRELLLGMGLVGFGSVVSAVGVPAETGYEFYPGHYVGANINAVTDYRFRGVSQTDGGPAVQGGFDYEYKPYNLYAGVWASNVDGNRGVYLFEDEVTGMHALSVEGIERQLDDAGIVRTPEQPDLLENGRVTELNASGYEGANIETDFYAGWAPQVTTTYGDWNFDLGYKRYQYFNGSTSRTDFRRKSPDASDFNTNEWHIGIEYDYFDRVQLGYTANYSDDYFGTDNSTWYHDFQLNVPLDEIVNYPGFNFHANYGLTRANNNTSTPITDAGSVRDLRDAGVLLVSGVDNNIDYDDYGVGVNYKAEGWLVDLSWIDRTKKEQCLRPFKCGSTALFTVGKSF